MEKKFKMLFMGAIGILLILSCSKVGFTASFAYFSISHAVHEDGRDGYRMNFEINDINGYTINQNVLNSLELMYDPSSSQIIYDTENIKFALFNKTISGRYDSAMDKILYNPVGIGSEYWGEIYDTFPNGTYRLTANVTTPLAGGHTIKITEQWNYIPVSLPVVSSNTFQISHDDSCNFIFEWDAPTGLNDLTHSRIAIEAFNQETYLGEIYISPR